MIPVTQTKVSVQNSKGETVVYGNCFAASIASLIELPITEVPNFEVFFGLESFSWYAMAHAWLMEKGFCLRDNFQFKVFHDGRYGVEDGVRQQFIEYCSGKYYMVTGTSPRGIKHCCIYCNGKMVHDPHPTREGIDETTITDFEEIVKI